MGMYHSTYFAYGVHIPLPDDAPVWEESNRIDLMLQAHAEQCPDVGHLTAGPYDADFLFLTTKCAEVDLGKFERVTPESHDTEQLADWNRQLAHAVQALGYHDLPGISAPGWICIPDLS